VTGDEEDFGGKLKGYQDYQDWGEKT